MLNCCNPSNDINVPLTEINRGEMWHYYLFNEESEFYKLLSDELHQPLKRREHYLILLEKGASEDDKACIDKDVSRIYSTGHRERSTEEVQAKVQRILYAFAAEDGAGYTAGMSFIALQLALHLSEEDAFWGMVLLFRMFKTKNILETDSNITVITKMIEVSCAERYPLVCAHFTENGIDITNMITTTWIRTFFTYSFGYETSVKIWDELLARGAKSTKEGVIWLFLVALALFDINKSNLKVWTFEQTIQNMRAERLSETIDPLFLVDTAKRLESRKWLKLFEANSKA